MIRQVCEHLAFVLDAVSDRRPGMHDRVRKDPCGSQGLPSRWYVKLTTERVRVARVPCIIGMLSRGEHRSHASTHTATKSVVSKVPSSTITVFGVQPASPLIPTSRYVPGASDNLVTLALIKVSGCGLHATFVVRDHSTGLRNSAQGRRIRPTRVGQVGCAKQILASLEEEPTRVT
jgi:hypothetical protein